MVVGEYICISMYISVYVYKMNARYKIFIDGMLTGNDDYSIHILYIFICIY